MIRWQLGSLGALCLVCGCTFVNRPLNPATTALENRRATNAFTFGKLRANLMVWNDTLSVTPTGLITTEKANGSDGRAFRVSRQPSDGGLGGTNADRCAESWYP